MIDQTQLRALVHELAALPDETEWVEFKHNKAAPDEIGEYVSALANSCALQGGPSAHMLSGIEDGTHWIASRIIRDAIDAKLIKPYGEPEGSRKDASYVPFWA